MKHSSLFIAFLLLLGIQQFGWSKIFTSTRNGDWVNGKTWDDPNETIPTAADTVHIQHIVTLTGNNTEECLELVIKNGGILEYLNSPETFTVYNNITLEVGGTFRASAPFTFNDYQNSSNDCLLALGKNLYIQTDGNGNFGDFKGIINATDSIHYYKGILLSTLPNSEKNSLFTVIGNTNGFTPPNINLYQLYISKLNKTDTCEVNLSLMVNSISFDKGILAGNNFSCYYFNKTPNGKITSTPTFYEPSTISYSNTDTTGLELPNSIGTLIAPNNSLLVLTKNVTITKELQFNNFIRTNINTITIDTSATVTLNGGGRIIGNLAKIISTTTTSKIFEIGANVGYSPITLNFNNVTTGGTITVSAISSTHPNTVDNTQTLKRYWTLTNNGTVFSTYDVTFKYLSVDFNTNFLEATDEAMMVVGKYNNGIWSFPTIGARTIGTSIDGGTIQVTGLTSFSDFIIAKNTGAVLSVKNVSSSIPTTTELLDNYPNPFNPTTTIAYNIAEKGLIKLVVFDILGKEITTLVNENQNPGSYIANFDASKISSGMYFYQLTAGGKIATKKMMVVK